MTLVEAKNAVPEYIDILLNHAFEALIRGDVLEIKESRDYLAAKEAAEQLNLSKEFNMLYELTYKAYFII